MAIITVTIIMSSILCSRRGAEPGMKLLTSIQRCDNMLPGQNYRTPAMALTDEYEATVAHYTEDTPNKFANVPLHPHGISHEALGTEYHQLYFTGV
jgi:hypothetical protein